MKLLEMIQKIAMYKECLASNAIEGNVIAEKHLRNCENMNLVDKYKYLKNVFDELKSRNDSKQ